MSGNIVLSQSSTSVLNQIEGALEVYFGKRVVLIDSVLKGGPITMAHDKNGKFLRQRREFEVAARFRFRDKGQTKKCLKIKCSLAVVHIWNEWWFVEEKLTPLFINKKEYRVLWEEPYSSVCDLTNTTVLDMETGKSWTGIAYNERWPTKLNLFITAFSY